MIKTYTLSDNSEFKTVTIPAGTLLFRGVHSEDKLHKEYIGDNYCISQTSQVFFYPAPYVSQCVDNYNIHIIYTTNYDLELLLLVKPSIMYKINNKDNYNSSIIKICSDISSEDSCGYKMSAEDPCFTELMLTNFPNIIGYIGLDKRDVGIFLAQQKTYLKDITKDYLKDIFPVILTNTRECVGVPEIVIHPLHLRVKEDYLIKRGNTRYEDDFKKYVYTSRAKYNFTPLLYVTEKNIFTFNDLQKKDTSNILKETGPLDYKINNGLFKNINIIMKDILSKGYMIDEKKYSAIIDKRTGFYRIKNTVKTRKQYNTMLKVFTPDTMTTESVPITYELPEKMSHAKMFEIAEIDEGLQTNEDVLNGYGISLSSEYIFDKGNYKTKYNINKIFPRSELGSYSRFKKENRNTRKKNRS